MRFIELFAGIGGFRYGLEEANRVRGDRSSRPKYRGSKEGLSSQEEVTTIEEPSNTDFRCVWANEWDKYACQIYRRHWGEVYEGDIRTVDPTIIPEHDLLCAGFPCQSFSIAGKRGGFEDTRGTLFFEICRVARAKRTKYLWLENVKGLLSHDEGNTFQTIIRTLDELGYDCQWQVLNSKDFGVPQNRERVFIIGHLRGQSQPKVFPIGETGKDDSKGVIETVGIIEADYSNDRGFHGSNYRPRHRILSENSIGRSLSTYENQMPYILHNVYGGFGETEPRVFADYSPSIRTSKGGGHLPMVASAVDPDGYLRTGARPRDENGKPQLLPIGYRRIRRLTPIECERLQGFPDNWTKYGLTKDGNEIEISDSQRYKCLGNAVTTNVITAIGKQLFESLYNKAP